MVGAVLQKLMLWWDEQIEKADLRSRLRSVGLPNTVIYVLGCATHAKDVLLADPPDGLQAELFGSVEILDRVWREFPSSLDVAWMRQANQEAMELEPDEEERVQFAFHEDELMAAVTFGLSVGAMSFFTDEVEKYALASLDRAYIFVYQYHHELNGFHSTEAEIRAVERESEACRAELQFQLDFLNAIERLRDRTLPYSEIRNTIK